jgi:hypothetical protein
MPTSSGAPFGSGTLTRSKPAEKAGVAASSKAPTVAAAMFMTEPFHNKRLMLSSLTLHPDVSCVNI